MRAAVQACLIRMSPCGVIVATECLKYSTLKHSTTTSRKLRSLERIHDQPKGNAVLSDTNNILGLLSFPGQNGWQHFLQVQREVPKTSVSWLHIFTTDFSSVDKGKNKITLSLFFDYLKTLFQLQVSTEDSRNRIEKGIWKEAIVVCFKVITQKIMKTTKIM